MCLRAARPGGGLQRRHLLDLSREDLGIGWFTTEYTQNAVTPVVQGNVVIVSGLDHPVRAVRGQRALLITLGDAC